MSETDRSQPTYDSGAFRDDLSHLRMIHFTILIVSATTIYFGIKAGPSFADLRRQLEALRDELNGYSKATIGPPRDACLDAQNAFV
jgi:hypothetical protein